MAGPTQDRKIMSDKGEELEGAGDIPVSVVRAELTRGNRPVVDNEVPVYISLNDVEKGYDLIISTDALCEWLLLVA